MAKTSSTVEFISLTTALNGVVTESDKREDTTTTSTAVECTTFEESEVIKSSIVGGWSGCCKDFKAMRWFLKQSTVLPVWDISSPLMVDNGMALSGKGYVKTPVCNWHKQEIV
ncbi:hypothetical protein AVEN_158804-1 [Araneus ventricosus]|uniref:Uncharacterized protein n=1 Tax=Araneus ventricosus TaxID=182803 RepID=A0A4Y2NNI6_ARAVE|nr:hypothetical protein AVEN_158804-1 [Araneus ventricosus]